MTAGAPLQPRKREALEEAARAVQDAQRADRDALLAAQRALKRAEKAHERAIRAAERELSTARRAMRAAGGEEAGRERRSAEIEAAERRLEAARADHGGVQETWPLLRKLAGLIEDEEEVLDLTSGVSAGHDGVVVVTDRRLVFLAPRRTLAFAHADLGEVRVRGRWLGANLSVSTATGKTVIGGLSPGRAREVAELIRQCAAGPRDTTTPG